MKIKGKIHLSLLQVFTISIIFLLSGCISDPESFYSPLSQLEPNDAVEEVHFKKMSKEELNKELEKLHEPTKQDYKLSPGDTFDLYVYTEPELDIKQMPVLPDGTITVGLIGNINVSGLSIDEANAIINKKLSKYLKNPKATLMPLQIKSGRATVLGAVNEPGIFQLENKHKLVDSIAQAKGFTMGQDSQGYDISLENLDLSYVIRDGKILPVNLTKAIYHGDKLNNIPIKSGDYIYIASNLRQMVYILGEVTSPMYIPFTKGLTLARSLGYVGGQKEVESSNVAIIVRGNLNNPLTFKVNVQEVLNGSARDFLLKPNDIIYFPPGGFYDYNLFINRVIPTFELINLALGPVGGTIPFAITTK